MSTDIKSKVQSGKFYRTKEEATMQVSRPTAGGGYESFPLKVEAGAVFKGYDEQTSFEVYDGMPVKETTHKIRVEGLDLRKTNGANSMETDARRLDDDLLEEISEEEYLKASKAFSERRLEKSKPGTFKNFLFKID